jgi:hypothetical protein
MFAIPFAINLGSVAVILRRWGFVSCNQRAHDPPMFAIPAADVCRSLQLHAAQAGHASTVTPSVTAGSCIVAALGTMPIAQRQKLQPPRWRRRGPGLRPNPTKAGVIPPSWPPLASTDPGSVDPANVPRARTGASLESANQFDSARLAASLCLIRVSRARGRRRASFFIATQHYIAIGKRSYAIIEEF